MLSLETNIKLRIASTALFVCAALYLAVTASSVLAYQTHYADGTGGMHSGACPTGTHCINPGAHPS